ncbi:MAG: tetratricopeptide repeat protein [Treponema sp.]|nr:tetratricopeptide repeat protein [Treponema sp.]
MKTLDTAQSAFERGKAYHHKGKYNKAIADFDQALRFRPDDVVIQWARELALAAKASEVCSRTLRRQRSCRSCPRRGGAGARWGYHRALI